MRHLTAAHAMEFENKNSEAQEVGCFYPLSTDNHHSVSSFNICSVGLFQLLPYLMSFTTAHLQLLQESPVPSALL